MKSINKKNIEFLNNKSTKNIEKLIKIMSYLRDPENGCAWDREQTFESIAPYTVEEAYEVVQAIQDRDFEGLQDELGDLLLQVVFLSQLANEKNLFNFEDVVLSIKEKLIRRHPHIFDYKNKKILNTPEDVRNQWDKIKLKEKNNNEFNKSSLDRVTKTLPSVLKSQKIQEEVSKDGFDFKNVEDCINKLLEELNEYKEALQTQNKKNLIDEGGDLLFSAINILRKSGINSEEALYNANGKFINRYRKAEELASNDGFQFKEITIFKKNEYWIKSKKFYS
ncbi:MAG: nucleoside triphosphate pyrophosphohydrolase [SAR116 cluster bacterium]|nr:nucleoside triphosphate pyrophosphohydrolase [SAR116 cluster bacterium]